MKPGPTPVYSAMRKLFRNGVRSHLRLELRPAGFGIQLGIAKVTCRASSERGSRKYPWNDESEYPLASYATERNTETPSRLTPQVTCLRRPFAQGTRRRPQAIRCRTMPTCQAQACRLAPDRPCSIESGLSQTEMLFLPPRDRTQCRDQTLPPRSHRRLRQQ